MTYPALFAAWMYAKMHNFPIPEEVTLELIRLGLPATKALQEYDNSLHRIVSVYIGDLRTKPLNEVGPFAIDFANAIETGLNEAWRLGMRENDVTEMDEEMQAIVDDIIASERSHIPDFAEFVTDTALNADTMGAAITGVEGRLQMWINRYEDVRNQAILYTADEKTRMLWVYGDTEHCDTCAALNGIVAYAREWQESGFHPQQPPNPLLGCSGFRCQCQLVPTTEKRTRNALDKLLNLATSQNI